MKRFGRIFGRLLVTSALISKAATAMGFTPQQPFDEDTWITVRREVEQTQTEKSLSHQIKEPILAALGAGANLRDTILISYRSVPVEKWPQLDRFWQDQPAIQTSAEGIRALVDVRSSLDGTGSDLQGPMYENWILRAHHRPGHYDNGGGND